MVAILFRPVDRQSVGKSYLEKPWDTKPAGLDGLSGSSGPLSRLFQSLASHTGKLPGFLKEMERQDLIVIEDFLLSPMTCEHRQELFEILDDVTISNPHS